MEHGNAREYIKRNPNVNRVRLLSQAASGARKAWFGVNDLY